jgi:hypothetical protein
VRIAVELLAEGAPEPAVLDALFALAGEDGPAAPLAAGVFERVCPADQRALFELRRAGVDAG